MRPVHALLHAPLTHPKYAQAQNPLQRYEILLNYANNSTTFCYFFSEIFIFSQKTVVSFAEIFANIIYFLYLCTRKPALGVCIDTATWASRHI